MMNCLYKIIAQAARVIKQLTWDIAYGALYMSYIILFNKQITIRTTRSVLSAWDAHATTASPGSIAYPKDCSYIVEEIAIQ